MMVLRSMSDLNTYLFNLTSGMAGTNPILDDAMILVARYLVLLIPLYLLYLWFREPDRDEHRKRSLFISLSVLLALLMAMSISDIYYHPRPFTLGLGTPLLQHAPDSSFPSDHATVMFATSFLLLFLGAYKAGSGFLVLSLLVGLARVFCGIHFPFDIVGSCAVGIGSAGALFSLRKKLDLLFWRLLMVYRRLVSIILGRGPWDLRPRT